MGSTACHDLVMSFHRGNVWASTSDEVPSLLDDGFSLDWERLGDIAEPQDAFWGVVQRYDKGVSTPAVVSVWIYVRLDAAIGELLLARFDEQGSSQSANEGGPRIRLAFAASSEPNARLLMASQPARLGISELRAPEVHPGLISVPSRPLCMRIEASDMGLFDRLA